jgi:hypothetical protein
MKDKNNTVYSLNIEDIQTVSIQEWGRELTDIEIGKVKDLICEKINWYDAILYSIIEKIDITEQKNA